jgi:hypothetical protein
MVGVRRDLENERRRSRHQRQRGVFILLVGLAAIGILIAPSAAWLALGPASDVPMGYEQLLAALASGSVDRIEQDGDELRVTVDGAPFRVVVPAGSNVAADVAAQAAVNPGRAAVPLTQAAPVARWLPLVLTGVLPVALVVGLLGWARGVAQKPGDPRAT